MLTHELCHEAQISRDSALQEAQQLRIDKAGLEQRLSALGPDSLNSTLQARSSMRLLLVGFHVRFSC